MFSVSETCLASPVRLQRQNTYEIPHSETPPTRVTQPEVVTNQSESESIVGLKPTQVSKSSVTLTLINQSSNTLVVTDMSWLEHGRGVGSDTARTDGSLDTNVLLKDSSPWNFGNRGSDGCDTDRSYGSLNTEFLLSDSPRISRVPPHARNSEIGTADGSRNRDQPGSASSVFDSFASKSISEFFRHREFSQGDARSGRSCCSGRYRGSGRPGMLLEEFQLC